MPYVRHNGGNMECISISFKSAAGEWGNCFVFSEEEKKKFLEQTGQAVVLNTCNRTEIYVTGRGSSFSLLERLLADKSGMKHQLRRISRRFGVKRPWSIYTGLPAAWILWFWERTRSWDRCGRLIYFPVRKENQGMS